MKLISLKPPFFKSKKEQRSVSRSEASSFGSSTSSSSSSGCSPKSVLSGRGKITRRELELVLRRLGPEEEVSAMLAEAGGQSGSGRFNLTDLAALGGKDVLGAPEMRETFAVFDVDGDGRISAEELLGIFQAIGDEGCTIEECRRMIGGVDSDGNGFVCFDDFVRMMDGQR